MIQSNVKLFLLFELGEHRKERRPTKLNLINHKINELNLHVGGDFIHGSEMSLLDCLIQLTLLFNVMKNKSV